MVDKRRPDRESHLESDYVTVGVGSLSEVRASLNHARASSTNWYVDPSTRSLRLLPNRSHAFVRVVVFDSVRRTMAHLHVVDLCGSQSLANARKSPSTSMVSEELAFFCEAPERGTDFPLILISSTFVPCRCNRVKVEAKCREICSLSTRGRGRV